MRTWVKPAAGLWLLVVLSMAVAASAAERDVRLVQAAAEQDRAAVRALLKQGADVNGARADGVTALLWAAHWDDTETVQLLLRAGANVNAADDYGVTALARATENASEKTVKALLDGGANPNAAQTSGLTPLMIAARTGNLNVMKLLLGHGADPNRATTEARATALMWAVAQGHAEIVQTLLEGSANPRVSTVKGFTPLMFAARNGDVEMARTLVAAGVDVNETGADGTHVLPYAIVNGFDKLALFLLEQGANPNGAIHGIPALHAASGAVSTWMSDWLRRHGAGGSLGLGGTFNNMPFERRLPLVKALLAKGADPNGRITTSAMFMGYIGYPTKGAFETHSVGTGDLLGATPLWVAAYTANGNVGGFGGGNRSEAIKIAVESCGELLKALMTAGADLRLTTVDGTTPLMVAAGLGRATFSPGLQRGPRSETAERAVQVLLDAGADVNAANEADFTALHGAAFRGLNEVIQVLVDRGADINARDFRGRTAYRMAEGAKQSFQFQAYPQTAEFIKKLGADTRLGVAGTVQERARDLAAAAAALRAGTSGQQQQQQQD
jgi:ankyrin repeat protein